MRKTIEQFIVSGMANKSVATQKSYRYSLNRFVDYLDGFDGDLDNLTRMDVQSYISWMQTVSHAAAASINREYSAIVAFCRFSKQEKAIVDIRVPKAQRVIDIAPKSLEKVDRNKLMRDVERDGNTRNIAIVYLLLNTGIRVGELVALDLRDVTLSDRTKTSPLIIRNGKGGKERVLPIPTEARRYIKEYLASRTDSHEALFVTEKGKVDRLSVRSVQHLLKQYGVHPHMLRHTLAKTLVDGGEALTVVAQLLGHNDINVTRRYTKPTMSDVADAMDRAYL